MLSMLAAKGANKTNLRGDDGGLAKGEARLLGGCASVAAHNNCVRARYTYIYMCVLRCRRC